MASILPFVKRSGVVFDDHVTSFLGEAFDVARRDLRDKGQPDVVYEIMATRIIEATKKGERDVIKQAAAGLAALGFQIETGGQNRFQ